MKNVKNICKKIYENSYVFCFVIAFFLNFIIEILARQSLVSAVSSIFSAPLAFFTNVMIIAFMLSVGNYFKKRNFVYFIVFVIWFGLATADFILLFFRVTPLCGADFMILRAAKGIVKLYLSFYNILAITAGSIIAILLAVFLYIKEKPKKPSVKNALIFSCITGIIAGAVSFSGILKPDFSDLNEAYKSYGFVYSFLSTVFDKGIDEPVDYSEKNFDDAIKTILDEPKSEPSMKPDIVFVQLESFFDINYLKDMTFSENPVPNFTALKEGWAHGFLDVPVVGGGTANTEFEILTGINLNFFGAGEYPFETVLRKQTCESIAYNLKDYGYDAHAIHNHTGDFYYRNEVYPHLGFDTFTSIEYMNGFKRNPMNWAKDSVLTKYITEALDQSDTPSLVYAVSVQPHGNYPKTRTEGEYPIHVGGAKSVDDMYRYTYYVNQLYETDKFIAELITALDMRGKPTIAVFYGDHIPALKIESDDLKNDDVYQTEYAIWDNIGLPYTEKELYSYQLSSYVLESFGMNSGIINRLHSYYKDNPEYENFLKIIAYDIFKGNHKDYLKHYEPTDMKMGLSPIEITDVQKIGIALKVYGTGFTEATTVLIDGNEVKTYFLDENTVVTYDAAHLKSDSIIKTAQISENNRRLSESNAYFYH